MWSLTASRTTANIAHVISRKLALEPSGVQRRGFDGDDDPIVTDALRGKQSLPTDVSADVDEDVPGSKAS